ncbi:MAG TPA: hypothetical protein VMH00_08245 [Candidatus Limnocylindrales bacterium]|nr:hypothetical protein [Candidatus Limnocylindrales bacterium]
MFEDRRIAPWFAIAGVCVTALGVYFNFQLERHSLVSTSDLEFVFLKHAFLPTFALGLVTSLVCGAIWAWQASAKSLILVGLSLVIFVGGASDVVDINIHTWTGCVMLVYAAGVLAGVLFIAVGLVRQRRL